MKIDFGRTNRLVFEDKEFLDIIIKREGVCNNILKSVRVCVVDCVADVVSRSSGGATAWRSNCWKAAVEGSISCCVGRRWAAWALEGQLNTGEPGFPYHGRRVWHSLCLGAGATRWGRLSRMRLRAVQGRLD